MRTKLQTESQLKIASAWRNYYAVKQAKIEVERRRQEAREQDESERRRSSSQSRSRKPTPQSLYKRMASFESAQPVVSPNAARRQPSKTNKDLLESDHSNSTNNNRVRKRNQPQKSFHQNKSNFAPLTNDSKPSDRQESPLGYEGDDSTPPPMPDELLRQMTCAPMITSTDMFAIQTENMIGRDSETVVGQKLNAIKETDAEFFNTQPSPRATKKLTTQILGSGDMIQNRRESLAVSEVT